MCASLALRWRGWKSARTILGRVGPLVQLPRATGPPGVDCDFELYAKMGRCVKTIEA